MFNLDEIEVNMFNNSTFVNLTDILERRTEVLDKDWSIYRIGNHILDKLNDLTYNVASPENIHKLKSICVNELNGFISKGIIREISEPVFDIQCNLGSIGLDSLYGVTEWDRFYMEIAEKMATKSKCSAKHVGCLLVRDSNILSIGINGTFPGAINCCDKFFKKEGIWYERREDDIYECEDQEAHFKWSLVHEVHAEMNAIAKANKNGVNVEGATAYVTHSPCYNCAKNLYTFGIKTIFYRTAYDDIYEVKELLKDFDITIVQILEDKHYA
jgi:dCMP deaminase